MNPFQEAWRAAAKGGQDLKRVIPPNDLEGYIYIYNIYIYIIYIYIIYIYIIYIYNIYIYIYIL